MPNKLEKLIYKMLTTNTGTHMCDSGGDNGRAWQKNQLVTLEGFKKREFASVEISQYGDSIETTPHIEVFHYLCSMLTLDKLCDTFNRKPVNNWEGDIYGVSDTGQTWIDKRFTMQGQCWNTYNWDCPLSQTLQGCNLVHNETGDNYVLLQIHNGADVRGGYTDAKLFKLDDNDCFLLCDLTTDYFDLYDNTPTNVEGNMLEKNELLALAKKLGVTTEQSINIPAFVCGT